MGGDLSSHIFEGLERLCVPERNGIVSAPAYPGIERIQAQFRGAAFEPHRHDTYALGVTIRGVQTFNYRGERRYSLPGRVIVLHPDEVHDGGAGTDDGLTYRILYLEPSLLLQCLEGTGIGLPFVDDPVVDDARLANLLLAALGELDRELDELFVDDFVSRVDARARGACPAAAETLGDYRLDGDRRGACLSRSARLGGRRFAGTRTGDGSRSLHPLAAFPGRLRDQPAPFPFDAQAAASKGDDR